MRPHRWIALAVGFAMIAGGVPAATAQPPTDVASRPEPGAAWTLSQLTGPLAQAAQERDRFRREQRAEDAAEPERQERYDGDAPTDEEVTEEEADADAEADAAEARLEEEEATEIAAEQGLLRARMALGGPVRSTATGERIGTVRDFAIDTERNQVALVVVSYGGNFGFGKQHVLVPFAAFEPTDTGKGLSTELTAEDIKAADSFTAGNWPNLASRDRIGQAYEQFGYEPYWTRGVEAERADPRRGEPLPITRATELVGRPVRGLEDNEKLGTLGDMVIDTREGRIVYGIFSRGGFFGFGEERVIVPYRALSYEPRPEHFVLDADEETIATLAFDNDNWPDLTDERWAARLHRTLNEEPYWQTFGYVDPVAPDAMPDETPRTILEEAGVSERQIGQLEREDYPIDRVEQALEQAYIDQGMAAEEAAVEAETKARRVEQLKQTAGVQPRELLREAGLTEPEIDALEADGYVRDEVEQALEDAYLDAGLDEQAARDLARRNAQRIVESMRFQQR